MGEKVIAIHRKSRASFLLPVSVPTASAGKLCGWCVQNCKIAEGEFGYCGLRTVERGKVLHLAGTRKAGLLHWYRDALPTNCVADWVCEGSKMHGYHNLAVFYGSCTFNCLFCQNWHFRDLTCSLLRSARQGKVGFSRNLMSAEELAGVADGRTFCVCFFGGDPASQMPHALATARRLAERGVRVCWETNGSMNQHFMKEAVKLSLETGGTVKFDLKAFSEGVHIALTGVTNKRTLENFALTTEFLKERKVSPKHQPSQPLVVASTLLVPAYVDEVEVGHIASFIASLSTDVPYALLAFHPQFYLSDLPTTSRADAEKAFAIAKKAGLKNVRIGNVHLLA